MRHILGGAGVGFLVLAAAIASADPSAPNVVRAMELASAGHCEEALPGLRAGAAPNAHAQADRMRAQCLLRTKRFAEATSLLEALLRQAPGDPELSLYQGIARFHTGDLDGARGALAAADDGRAETYLYRGLLLLDARKFREAAESLERAISMDPAGAGRIASYYAAYAWARAGEGGRARARVQSVHQSAPGSVWARSADQILGFSPPEGARDWWLKLSGGFEWDSNVTLQPDEETRLSDVSGQSDVDGTWTLDAGAELWSDSDWSFGVRGSFVGNAHRKLSNYDLLYPTASAWLERHFGPRTLVRARYDFGYAWIDTHAMLLHHTFSPSLAHAWGKKVGVSQVFGQLFYYDSFVQSVDVPDGTGAPGSACPDGLVVCGPPGIDEKARRKRDGPGLAVGVGHAWPLPWGGGRLRSTYAYQRFFAEGSESRYQSHSASLGLRFVLPFDIVADGGGSFTYRRYAGRSTLPDFDTVQADTEYAILGVRRRDDIWQAHISLERDIGPYINAAIRYHYRDNRSNLSPFDYHRHIVGFYVTVALGHR